MRQDVPGPGEVHLWRIDLGATAALGELTDRELARANQFQFDRDRRRFLAAHAGLRTILARYLQVAARDIELIDAPSGKPGLRGSGPRFSLSHSADLALVALSARDELGVDVEMSRDTDIDDIARTFLTRDERALLEQQSDELARRDMFFRIWTRREARAKADGRGIGAESAATPDGWTLHDLAPAPGFVGALVVCGPSHDLRYFDLPPG
jgi:4'-phosphopantetheinyl transferase